MKKVFYWADMEWYDAESNKVVGDMGFTFCDAQETMTENPQELIDSIKDDAKEYTNGNSDFPIYSVLKAEFELESEDEYPTFYDEIEDTREIIFTCAYCKSERAKEIEAKGVKLDADFYGGDIVLN